MIAGDDDVPVLVALGDAPSSRIGIVVPCGVPKPTATTAIPFSLHAPPLCQFLIGSNASPSLMITNARSPCSGGQDQLRRLGDGARQRAPGLSHDRRVEVIEEQLERPFIHGERGENVAATRERKHGDAVGGRMRNTRAPPASYARDDWDARRSPSSRAMRRARGPRRSLRPARPAPLPTAARPAPSRPGAPALPVVRRPTALGGARRASDASGSSAKPAEFATGGDQTMPATSNPAPQRRDPDPAPVEGHAAARAGTG